MADLELGGLNVHLCLRQLVRANAAKPVDGALLIPKASKLIMPRVVISDITHCVATEGVAIGWENPIIIRCCINSLIGQVLKLINEMRTV